MSSRNEVVKLASSWLGKNEYDQSHKFIIDTYNSFTGQLPRGTKMEYDWPWCACFWSTLAISLGYTDIMPIEISCGDLIKQAQKMGCWQENDGYIPKPADAVLYDWDDLNPGGQDNKGWPEHVGVVEYCNEESGYFTVIEGNYKDSVKKRTVSINGKYIRGFITPKYDEGFVIYEDFGMSKDVTTVAREAIVGLWGNGESRKAALERNGYNYDEVQAKINELVNGPAEKPKPSNVKKVETSCYAKSEDPSLAGTYVTTTNLYCRNDAGTNKKALCLIPEGTEVQNYGYFTKSGSVRWLLIQFTLDDGIEYTGFSSSEYLRKK